MSGFHSASEYVKTCIVLLLCTGCVFIIAYSAPYWTTRPDGKAGLWLGCTGKFCYERWELWTSAWIKASQAFMTMSFITWFFSTVLLFAFVYHRSLEGDMRIIFLCVILTFGTAVFILIAVLVWVGNEHFGSGEILNWPYFMACACSIASFFTGVFLVLELRTPQYEKYTRLVDVERSIKGSQNISLHSSHDVLTSSQSSFRKV